MARSDGGRHGGDGESWACVARGGCDRVLVWLIVCVGRQYRRWRQLCWRSLRVAGVVDSRVVAAGADQRRRADAQREQLPCARRAVGECVGAVGWSGGRRDARVGSGLDVPRRRDASVSLRCGVVIVDIGASRERGAARVRVAAVVWVGLSSCDGVDERPAVLIERRLVHVPCGGVGIVCVACSRRGGGRHAADGCGRRLLVIGGGGRGVGLPSERDGGVGSVCERVVARVCEHDGIGGRSRGCRGEHQRARVHVERRPARAADDGRVGRRSMARSDGGRHGGDGESWACVARGGCDRVLVWLVVCVGRQYRGWRQLCWRSLRVAGVVDSRVVAAGTDQRRRADAQREQLPCARRAVGECVGAVSWSGGRRDARVGSGLDVPRRRDASVSLRCGVVIVDIGASRERGAARVRVAAVVWVGLSSCDGVDERPAVLIERRLVHVPCGGVGIVCVACSRRGGGRHAADGCGRRLLVIGGGGRGVGLPSERDGGVGSVCERVVARVCEHDGIGGRSRGCRGEHQRARVHVERRPARAADDGRVGRRSMARSDGGRHGGDGESWACVARGGCDRVLVWLVVCVGRQYRGWRQLCWRSLRVAGRRRQQGGRGWR